MGFKYSRTIEKAQILSHISWNRSSSSSSQGSWQPWEAQGQFQEELGTRGSQWRNWCTWYAIELNLIEWKRCNNSQYQILGHLAIIPGLVSEIHANFLKDMAWDLTEVNLEVVQYYNRKGAYSVYLVCFILCELARTRQHSLKNICEGWTCIILIWQLTFTLCISKY